MNIAIFTDTFIPRFDGIITSILNTTGELTRRGHKVKIIAPRIVKEQEKIIKEYDPGLDVSLMPGVKALFYPGFRITLPASPWIIREMKKMKADIIHFHTPFTLGMEAILAAAYLRTPLASTFHTYFIEPEYLKIIHLHRLPGLTRFGWAYSNFYHNMCDVTISPSRFTADELGRNSLRCPIRVVSNGIPLREPRKLSGEEKEAVRKKYNLKKNVLLFIGRVSVEKGIDVVMKAAKKIFEERDDTTLLIVGDGPASDYLKRTSVELGIDNNTVFTGGISHEKLLESGIFDVANLFVTASTSENQPMTIIEASMFGLPIIGVKAKGVTEMITDNGFAAEPGNHEEIAGYMKRLLSDETLHREMSVNSMKKGGEYDIQKTTDKMLEVYDVISKKVKRQGRSRRPSLKTLYKIFMGGSSSRSRGLC